MNSVSPRDQEHFHLRLPLQLIPGSQSYEDLRTVNGGQIMLETVENIMPCQMRNAFAYLLVFANVMDPLQL